MMSHFHAALLDRMRSRFGGYAKNRLPGVASRGLRPLGLLGAAVAGAGLFPAASQAPASPPQNIFGTYARRLAGRDSIRVSRKANGKIGLTISLHYENGHTCQMSQDGEWRDDHVVVTAEGLDATHPCFLQLFFDKGRVVLKDVGYQCAPVYCGTRGKLDSVTLPKINTNRK